MVYNTERFVVRDVPAFKDALEKFRPSLEEAGGTDIRVFTNLDQPGEVFTSMWWPNPEACRMYAKQHMSEFEKILGPHLVSYDPEYLWEELS
jgi:hypothetical protein